MKLFALVASYKGISDEQALENCAAETLREAGHTVRAGVLKGLALIDLARAELQAAFMASDCDAALLQDDDVQVEGPSVLDLLKCGKDVVSAPCLMRSESDESTRSDKHLFNVIPITKPVRVNGVRLAECAWTGLGCVLVRRAAFEKLIETYTDMHFMSSVIPGRRAYALYNSVLVPANTLDPTAPEGEQSFMGDDRAFSVRMRAAGMTIWASVDARTDHRGIKGCLGEEMRPASGLVDSGGRPLGS